jgi:hypothetical protein
MTGLTAKGTKFSAKNSEKTTLRSFANGFENSAVKKINYEATTILKTQTFMNRVYEFSKVKTYHASFPS